MPSIYNALRTEVDPDGPRSHRDPHPVVRGRPTPRRRQGARRRPRLHRRAAARPGDRGHRQRRDRPGRPRDARPRLQPGRRADRRPRPGRGQGPARHPSVPARVRRSLDQDRDLRDGDQGHRPALPAGARRQGRPLRRRRRRQDGHHPGADRPPGALPLRLLLLRRGRRADPRGQRPLARDAGGQDRRHRQVGHRPDRDGLRPDERAAGRAAARGALGPDHGRALPRPDGGRHPAVHRQHLPLHPGGLRGVGAARPHAFGGRLPADAVDRDGRAAGAHHLDQPRRGHLDPGDLRPRRRLHRPGTGQRLHPPRLDGEPRALDLREGHLPGGRPARLVEPPAGAGVRRRTPLRGGAARAAGVAALQGPAGHHRHPRR